MEQENSSNDRTKIRSSEQSAKYADDHEEKYTKPKSIDDFNGR